MSPQKPTPEHSDDPALILALDIWGDENMRGDALVALEALKAAGFEVTKRPELGVTKGLPGIAAEAGIRALKQLTAGMKFPPPPEPDRVLAYPTWGLEHLAPGATQAAQTGMEIANRTIAYGSLDPDEALKMALDLIGRRSDVVAVQLPEPDNGFWYINEHGGNVHLGPVAGQMLVDAGAILWGINTDEARELAAALLAAANVADAAEDGGK